jgi:hypothetical protein
VTSPHDVGGLTGLQELAVAIGIAALLSVGGLFTYRVLISGSNDKAVQATITSAKAAAADVYQDTQDYALISSADPNPDGTGACALDTSQFGLLKAYAGNVTFSCGALQSYAAGTVVYSSGELTDGDAGGWIGIAARARDGVCWQVYVPADAPPVFGSQRTPACQAPTAAPTGGGAGW